MDTPICDFVERYAKSNGLRLHMPGHKGKSFLGVEQLDITEIQGADSLYEASGIIARSEENAGKLFGCKTIYSAEGSSQCIRAMLYLALQYARANGKRPLIAAGRNAHKAFVTAAALLDMEVDWLYPEENQGYLSCNLTPAELEAYFREADRKPTAVYLTSPDYLGNMADISGISEVCRRYDILLLVDNAHGAYLKFLPQSLHPMDLGADLCCDSAHKTLPVLTGGAYLHLSDRMNRALGHQAKNAMMLFGSTSPSYLILQSLDAANVYLQDYPRKLGQLLPEIWELRQKLQQRGYAFCGDEPLKLTVDAKAYGYRGDELANLLRRQNIEPEFSDPDYVVLLLSAEADKELLRQLEVTLCEIPPKRAITEVCPRLKPGKCKLSPREAMLSDAEVLPIRACVGRILTVPTVGCPPAVPILVCGEEIDEYAVACFEYYGMETCCVVREL